MSGETKFTSGPWVIDHESLDKLSDHERALIGSEGRNGGIYVAHALGPDARANAHLIAASPDMYEALVELVDFLDDPGIEPAECGPMKLAQAALAKARGESQ